jgi:uncharacterized protein (TIGR03435 family)
MPGAGKSASKPDARPPVLPRHPGMQPPFRSLAAALLSTLLSLAAAQTLRFDAASLKPLPPPPPPPPGEQIVSERVVRVSPSAPVDPSRIHSIATLRELVATAYDAKEVQVAGPSWIDSDRFVLDATMPPQTTRDQRLQMLRTLLVERFHLVTHRETREIPIYSLVVARQGILMKESSQPESTIRTVAANGRVTLTAQGATMPELAANLTRQLDRPVKDETAAKAKYDFVLSFTAEVPNAAPPPTDAPDLPDVFAALPSQLGLRLNPHKGPVELIVIDQAERTPAAN